MSGIKGINHIDDGVDNEIYACLNLLKPKSFFLFAGAGSGKTRSLVNVLSRFKDEFGKQFKLNRRKIAIITYTNAAADEIKDRLGHDEIFYVSTIHSFAWELIRYFTSDIKLWIKQNLNSEILELKEAQSKSRDLNNKTSIDRARKIEAKEKRLLYLEGINQFIYNPNGDNISKDSLNHSEVIGIAANFIASKPLMQDIIVSIYPVIMVDESQDTKRELMDALFILQNIKRSYFSLGLFGDTMQRIYADGKEGLGDFLPADWLKPAKSMNHRSNKRIINLINDIRKSVDNQVQIPRSEKEEGYVRLFICPRNKNKAEAEIAISKKMAELTSDKNWDIPSGDIKMLILEHHMAAKRMGFMELFEPLYKVDKLRTGLLDGTLSGLNLYTKILAPIIESHRKGDKFGVARVVKKHSPLLQKEELLKYKNQVERIENINRIVSKLLLLWGDKNDPTLLQILKEVHSSGLFPVSNTLNIIASRTEEEIKKIDRLSDIDGDENIDEVIEAWDLALQAPFSQIERYNTYLSAGSKFGTHQGVKGLQYPRVMVIIDDEEARGFLFSYDKLFGSKELSAADKKNKEDGKEIGVDRTRRLFYVACSRAQESLAIVAYTDNPAAIKSKVIGNGWFKENEIEVF